MLLIDTYNVLHVVGVLPPEIAGIDAWGLIDLLRDSRYRAMRTILVCDGIRPADGPEGAIGPVNVRYSGPCSADEIIIRLIERSSAPRRLIVVSSDRQILRAGRKRRCSLLTSEELLAQLGEDYAVRQMEGRPKGSPANEEDSGAAERSGPEPTARPRRPQFHKALPGELIDQARGLESLDEASLDAELAERLGSIQPADAPSSQAPAASGDSSRHDESSSVSSGRTGRGTTPAKGGGAAPPGDDGGEEAKRPPSPAPPSGDQLRSVLPASLIAEAEAAAREAEAQEGHDGAELASPRAEEQADQERMSGGPPSSLPEAGQPAQPDEARPDASATRHRGDGRDAMLPADIISEAEALLRSFEAEEGSMG